MLRFAAAVLLLACLAPLAPAEEVIRHDGWVVLPVEEYKALRSKAFPLATASPEPPVPATLSRLDYDLKVAGETASGEVRLTIDVLREGYVRMPIPAGLLVRDARIDGHPVSIVGSSKGGGAGAAAVLLNRVGRSVLVLEVGAPLASEAGVERLSLPPSGSAVSSVRLVIPRKGLLVGAGGGLLEQAQETAGATRLVAHGYAGGSLQLSWRPELPEKKAVLPLRFRGQVTEMAGLGEDSVQVSAECALEVLQGAASKVTLELPEGIIVNQVSGGLLGDWEARGRTLTVSFLEPVEARTSFVVAGEAKGPRDGLVTVPLVRLTQAERETGGVAVEVLGEGEIRSHRVTGMQDAAPAELGATIANRDSPSLQAFRYHVLGGEEPRSLVVDVARYSAQAVAPMAAEEGRYRVLLWEEGKTLVQARWAVRNNQGSFLTVTLPPGAELWSAATGGRPVKPGRATEGVVLVPLEKARPGTTAVPFIVEVVYAQRGSPWGVKGEARIPLPSVNVEVARTGIELQYSPRYRLSSPAGPFRIQAFEAPYSAAFRAPQSGAMQAEAAADAKTEDRVTKDLLTLRDTMQKELRGRRVEGVLPLEVSFPSLGVPLFLTAELTAQDTAPVVELAYQRAKN